MLPGDRGLIPGRTGAFSGRTWVAARGPGVAPTSVGHIAGSVIVVIISSLSLPSLKPEDRPSQSSAAILSITMARTAPTCCPDMHSCVVLAATLLGAQAPAHYRTYRMGDPILAVSRQLGVPVPPTSQTGSTVRELRWRADYVPRGTGAADPVERLMFSFHA